MATDRCRIDQMAHVIMEGYSSYCVNIRPLVRCDIKDEQVKLTIVVPNYEVTKDPERKLFYKWVKDFIKPVMKDEERCWRYECVMMKRICYDPLKKPIDIRYAVDGLYINDMRIN